ncbi:MAG: polysaccharide deacetylase family protein [Pseudomonadota bacterium]
MKKDSGYGALVISLDFELHWGMREKTTTSGNYRQNFLGVREVIPKILAIFDEFGIAATWATVGFLFANSKQELESFSPTVKPLYDDAMLFPYREEIGQDEKADPFHYAPSLIKAIQRTPRQEIATHTFSHYYCLEPGQTKASFEADLKSAIAIAKPDGIQLKSIVFPRNQHNHDYEDILLEAGISCYRGNQSTWMYRASNNSENSKLRRAARLIDTYIPIAGSHTINWENIRQHNGICNVPASFFLRAYSPRLKGLEKRRLRRITQSIKKAAISHQIVHLWWHPHNFGVFIDDNLAVLRAILNEFKHCQENYGMRSMSMAEVALTAQKNREKIK